MNSTDNYEDIIDSRDIIARIEELEEERLDEGRYECNVCGKVGTVDDGCEDAGECPDEDCDGTVHVDDSDWDGLQELVDLKKFAEQGEDYCADWQHGETLIRYSYFEHYARELAEDCCELPTGWPFHCIDWAEAARELQMDYTSLDYDGVTYWAC